MNRGTALPLQMNAHVVDPDSELVVLTNCALLLVCVAFVGYLAIPGGARKRYCNSHPRRFARTSFVLRDCDVLTPIVSASPDRGYDSIDDGYTSFAPRSPSRSDLLHGGCSLPTPLIMDPGIACLSKGQATPNAPSSHRWSTPGKTSRTHGRQTPATARPPPTIEEDVNNNSPNSVSDKSEHELPKKLLVLVSTRCLDPQQEQNQRDAIALLRQRKVPFETVDGMNPLQRTRREELYRISGARAQYPQFFFLHADGRTTHLGDFKTLQNLHHAEGLPRSYRNATPGIMTWNEIFCDTSQIFSV
ncbi:hypothetical protein MHU86_913 [Fragilaria crotonensis]|nr:hypothetical protein MHU86_913 [Fragilaria crotonensis]